MRRPRHSKCAEDAKRGSLLRRKPQIAASRCDEASSGARISKAHSVTRAIHCFRVAAVAQLFGDIERDELPRSKTQARSTPKGARGERADLVQLTEVLRADREHGVQQQTGGLHMRQWKFQTREARRLPGDRVAGKSAARTVGRDRPSKTPSEIGSQRSSEQQNMRALIPEPVLVVGKFQRAKRPGSRNVEATSVFPVGLRFRNDPAGISAAG